MTPGQKVLKSFEERGYRVFQRSKGLRGETDGWLNTDDTEIAGLIEQESGIVEMTKAIESVMRWNDGIELAGSDGSMEKGLEMIFECRAALANYRDKA